MSSKPKSPWNCKYYINIKKETLKLTNARPYDVNFSTYYNTFCPNLKNKIIVTKNGLNQQK